MDKKRSIGVTIFGWLNVIFFGGISLILYILVFLLALGGSSAKIAAASGQSIMMFRVSMVYGILLSAALIVTGLGVLKLKERARTQTIYLAIVMLLADIFFSMQNFSTSGFLLSLIYPAIIIIFFSLPKTKEQFKQQQPAV
ncbi:MAG: hypothetical protein PHW54_01690 [Candidatus Omnitrophica bacterium]|jgi:membrane-associated HD superfamily phosphohydrolase|nr:hypothetical protein [Candidatus Omnitrophota bacterium]